ncbi:hypothetical protein A33M_2244 [Rhodovulum sp. PH10]|uniref:hypothetical protein n=1 Tax=Rhodovulum sp. PH10 TaxID=1187851 RepID=UPI00027C2646|nr:hypothetical protein [Rhodovulum sp. PH10]EJW12121.1 hypothetical protein A33M_2244 [Rhodovulum sp. PH10]
MSGPPPYLMELALYGGGVLYGLWYVTFGKRHDRERIAAMRAAHAAAGGPAGRPERPRARPQGRLPSRQTDRPTGRPVPRSARR